MPRRPKPIDAPRAEAGGRKPRPIVSTGGRQPRPITPDPSGRGRSPRPITPDPSGQGRSPRPIEAAGGRHLPGALLRATVGQGLFPLGGVPPYIPVDPATAVYLGLYDRQGTRDPEQQVADAVADFCTRIGLGYRWLADGDKVLLKVACNSPYAHPAVTSPTGVEVVCHHLNSQRSNVDIVVGDQAGVEWVRRDPAGGKLHATADLMKENGLASAAAAGGAKLRCFDDPGESYTQVTTAPPSWAKVNAPLKLTSMVSKERQFDHILYLPRLGAHSIAGYSAGHKCAIGFLSDESRYCLHHFGDQLHEMFTEISYVPEVSNRHRMTLTVVDKAMLDVGPDFGHRETVDPIIIFASAHLANHDAMAVALLDYLDLKYNDPERNKEIVMAGGDSPQLSALEGLLDPWGLHWFAKKPYYLPKLVADALKKAADPDLLRLLANLNIWSGLHYNDSLLALLVKMSFDLGISPLEGHLHYGLWNQILDWYLALLAQGMGVKNPYTWDPGLINSQMIDVVDAIADFETKDNANPVARWSAAAAGLGLGAATKVGRYNYFPALGYRRLKGKVNGYIPGDPVLTHGYGLSRGTPNAIEVRMVNEVSPGGPAHDLLEFLHPYLVMLTHGKLIPLDVTYSRPFSLPSTTTAMGLGLGGSPARTRTQAARMLRGLTGSVLPGGR